MTLPGWCQKVLLLAIIPLPLNMDCSYDKSNHNAITYIFNNSVIIIICINFIIGKWSTLDLTYWLWCATLQMKTLYICKVAIMIADHQLVHSYRSAAWSLTDTAQIVGFPSLIATVCVLACREQPPVSCLSIPKFWPAPCLCLVNSHYFLLMAINCKPKQRYQCLSRLLP